MRCELSEDLDLIKSIITNPLLFRLTAGKSENSQGFKVDKSWKYLIFRLDDNTPVACVQIKELTKIVLEVHIFVLPKFWGNQISLEVVTAGHEWIKSQGYRKTFTRVPANCVHILKFLNQINYKVCGMIENGIVHNNFLVTLFFYEHELN